MKKLIISFLSVTLIFGCTAAISYAENGVYSDGISITSEVSPFQNMSDEELANVVSTIGEKLVEANGIKKNVTFKLSLEDIPNAFTDIDDVVTVYKGLIDYCSSYDELAFIIGHELGHATNNHVIKSVGANWVGGLAVNAATRFASMSVSNSQLGAIATRGANVGSNLANSAVQNKYSRSQEFSADYAGIDYMTKAGYNPNAAISIMDKIGINYRDFWTDHPSTDKRIEAMNSYIKKHYPKYVY